MRCRGSSAGRSFVRWSPRSRSMRREQLLSIGFRHRSHRPEKRQETETGKTELRTREEGKAATLRVVNCVGGVISPLLANIYLHTVLDEWFMHEVEPRLDGEGFL